MSKRTVVLGAIGAATAAVALAACWSARGMHPTYGNLGVGYHGNIGKTPPLKRP